MRTCGECAYKALEGGKCPFFHLEMKDDEPGCPVFSTSPRTCALCGGTLIPRTEVIDMDDEGKYHTICKNCLNVSPCQICKNTHLCYFQTDTTCQEPPMIMKQVRQGNMVMQTQIMNPKRVMATCTRCECFNEEGLDTNTHCRKTLNNGCPKHKTNWRD